MGIRIQDQRVQRSSHIQDASCCAGFFTGPFRGLRGNIRAHWEVRRESDRRNNKHKTHTQAERGSMTERRDPRKISVGDTN